MLKSKVFWVILLILTLFIAKWVLWDMEISSGKRVGNLTKISKKGRFPFFKTWEGTLDEGSGDQLTTQFSVKNEKIGQELYAYEGKEVILFYGQHILGFPRDTNYVVMAWKPKQELNKVKKESPMENKAMAHLQNVLFCSLIGSLYKDPTLYHRVKEFIKKENIYLFYQYKKCNSN